MREEPDLQRVEMIASKEWRGDCLRWRGMLLTAAHAHWCPEWDGLPIDETSLEWPCGCSESEGVGS